MGNETKRIPRVARFKNALTVKVTNRSFTLFALNGRFLLRIKDAQRAKLGGNLEEAPVNYGVVRGRVSVMDLQFSPEAIHALRILFQEYEKQRIEPERKVLPRDN